MAHTELSQSFNLYGRSPKYEPLPQVEMTPGIHPEVENNDS